MAKINFQKGKAEKLLQDKKSRFSQFVKKNDELKRLDMDYIEGEIDELYVFFQSGINPEWEKRMIATKY